MSRVIDPKNLRIWIRSNDNTSVDDIAILQNELPPGKEMITEMFNDMNHTKSKYGMHLPRHGYIKIEKQNEAFTRNCVARGTLKEEIDTLLREPCPLRQLHKIQPVARFYNFTKTKK